MSPTVVPLHVKPKTLTRQYKQHKIIVRYVPADKQWSWTVEATNVTRFTDVANSQMAAFKAAEKLIDSFSVERKAR